MTDSPSWWKQMLDRRQANQRVALSAVAIAGAGSAIASSACDAKPSEREADALELQRAHGWSVGYETESLAIADASEVDSLGNADWQTRRSPEALLAATRPTSDRWRSHESPAVFQSLAQPSLAQAIRPMHTDAMDRAHGIGRALGELIDASENPQSTFIIIDLPGAQSVAAAAGMATMVEPVFWLDNWPHPRGVVASHEPLAAAIYYAAELEAAAPQRQAQHATVMVLDRQRLVPYTDAASQFDNRYMAELPDAAALQSYGIDKVVYLTESASDRFEADDLNEVFVEYGKVRINVVMMNLEQFGQDPAAAGGGAKDGDPERYYYGHERSSHSGFYGHHMLFLYIPGRRYNFGSGTAAAARVRPTGYSPTPRRTMFSSRTAGASSGIGRTRPTGFGRITHATDGSGRVTSMRSGSYGRHSSGVSG